jgi:uncharacterized RDD family membrane protein YckC
VNDREGTAPAPGGHGEALTGPGRFAAPRYTGSEYGAPDQAAYTALERASYGHYDGQPYVPRRDDPAKQLMPLPEGIRYASWGSRFAAYLVDILSLTALFLVADVMYTVVGPGSAGGVFLGTAVWVTAALSWLYQMTWRQGVRGQSWGKQLLRIHLVSAVDHRPPGGAVGIGRWLVRSCLASASAGIYTFVTALWPLSDERMRTLDDKMSGTLVVRLPREQARY